jgi:alpha-galactosidase
LDPAARYKVLTIDDRLVETQSVLSGSYLMNQGLNMKLGGDFDSTIIILEKM